MYFNEYLMGLYEENIIVKYLKLNKSVIIRLVNIYSTRES